MTDSKTATERACELLDERGVEYSNKGDSLYARIGDLTMNLSEFRDRLLCITLQSFVTPEQAIAATLGTGECIPTEDYCCQCGQDLVLCDTGIGPNGGAVELDPPMLFNYCPNCGRKVVDDDR